MGVDVRIAGMEKSPTLAVNEMSAAMVADGQEVFRFGFGQSPFPVPAPLVAELQAHAGEKDYEPVAGVRGLQDAVAAAMEARTKTPVAGEDIMIGPGSKELLMSLQIVLDAVVSIPAASWVSYVPQSDILGRTSSVIPTQRDGGWKLTPELVDDHFGHADRAGKANLLILNYPSNPTGLTYDDAELAALAPVLRKHGVVVLADEIYGNVHHQGNHVSLAAHYPEGTIISDGLSKWAGAGGWRLGHFCFPPQLADVRDAMHVVASETFSATSAPIQYAAIAAYPTGDSDAAAELKAYLDDSRAILDIVGSYVASTCNQAGFLTPAPQGGFYIFPSANEVHGDALAAKGITTNVQLATQLLQDTGVATLPGKPFAVPDTELSLRLAFVDFDGGNAIQTLRSQPSATVSDLAPHVVKGIDRAAHWFQSL